MFDMDFFYKIHIFELLKSHIYEPNISLVSENSLMLNYAKPRLFMEQMEDVIKSKFECLVIQFFKTTNNCIIMSDISCITGNSHIVQTEQIPSYPLTLN